MPPEQLAAWDGTLDCTSQRSERRSAENQFQKRRDPQLQTMCMHMEREATLRIKIVCEKGLEWVGRRCSRLASEAWMYAIIHVDVVRALLSENCTLIW